MNMNRIESHRVAAAVPQGGAAGVASQVSLAVLHSTTAPSGMAIFAPLHYEPNYRYPLLVWLHGPRDNEGQLRRIMPLVSMRNYVAIAPRGTQEMEHAGRTFYGWGHSNDELYQAAERLRQSVEAARNKFSIDPSRVFLGGFDCGGTMALRLALNDPGQFAGVLSVGGALPTVGRPLAQINQARRLPVFIACGRESQHYPQTTVCENLRLLHAAGMSVSLRQYPGGQDLCPQILGDMDRWMMETISAGCPAC